MDAPAPSPSDGDHEESVAAVNNPAARRLYAKRPPIYPKAVDGTFRRLKWAMLAVLLCIYYAVPWVRWARGAGRPDQAVLVDFAARRFYFGPLELWPQEIYYITGLLIVCALALFLFTALFGRVWCGYACPQTVWTDLYLWVERRVEGDRNAQLRLAKSPWTLDKVRKKLVKHALWLVIAAATGGAWVFYFGDAPTLARALFTGTASTTVYFFVALFTFTTYSLAGTMREQVCTFMCPWPRIQAAMIDEHSLQVTYRGDRGEPRAPHKKGAVWTGRGDCIDCTQCVAVCPMGIDIRDGLQLECINCALCIDACDEVMDRVERPRGLIAYYNVTDAAKSQGGKNAIAFLRPRTLAYGALITLVGALIGHGLMTRPTIQLDIIHDRTPPFVRLEDGSIRNAYQINLLNMRAGDRDIVVTVEGAKNAKIKAIGASVAGEAVKIHALSDKVAQARVFVAIPAADLAAAAPTLVFATIDPRTHARIAHPTAFLQGRSS